MRPHEMLTAVNWDQHSWWTRFWHRPVRSESLALVRILFGCCLLAEQFIQILPFFPMLFGGASVAPVGVNDEYLLGQWRWAILIFNTDNMAVNYAVFGCWILFTFSLTIGFKTRWSSVLVWLGMMLMIARNPNVKNGGDDILQIGLFLLMFSRCNASLSIDSWLKRRKSDDRQVSMISPWPIRLFQIQLCVIYCTTGLAKLRGDTWPNGTSLHYVLNDMTLTRWSYAQLPLPIYITAPMTWMSLAFEILFPLFVLFRKTRLAILLFGISFHIGIHLTIEVGWFSLYTLCMYAAWIPSAFWFRARKNQSNQVQASD